jgi:16S rRNA (cytosine967-C5)-methyltransferase
LVRRFFEENFDDEWVAEASALSERAPLDMRVNTLKADRDKVQKQLAKFGAKPTKIARHGLRIAPGKGPDRLPNVQAEPAFQKGWFEIQDEGSQIVADLVFAQPGEQVFDYCAGGGGKTLALSAALDNKGQVHAWDADKSRLAPIFDRLKRAGTRNVQVHAADADLSPLEGRMDRVLVDAPCTGSGTWRRNPDAKWRLQPGGAGKAAGGTGRGARQGVGRRQARRLPRLCHLFALPAGKRVPGLRLRRPARRTTICCRRARSGRICSVSTSRSPGRPT